MFKKKKIIDTPIDRELKQKDDELFFAQVDLERVVANIIVANGVIELYPKGADKEKTKQTKNYIVFW